MVVLCECTTSTRQWVSVCSAVMNRKEHLRGQELVGALCNGTWSLDLGVIG